MKQWIFLSAALLVSAGCKTTELGPAKPLPWRMQQAYVKRVRDPRIFGMDLVQTPSGVEIRGGGRFHDWQQETLDMMAANPIRPVVSLAGGVGQTWPVLLDLTASKSWLSYDVARQLKAHPVAEGKPVLVRLPGETDIMACLSTTSSVKLGQLQIEHPIVYVRLATGSMGPLARGITTPGIQGVVGWNALRQFQLIQLIYPAQKVTISMLDTDEYEPHPEYLVASLPIIKNETACMVRGTVNGKEMPILIDPAGDFQVATPGGVQATIGLGDGLVLSGAGAATSPAGVRVGAQLLQNYLVTICPKDQVLHLELLQSIEAE